MFLKDHYFDNFDDAWYCSVYSKINYGHILGARMPLVKGSVVRKNLKEVFFSHNNPIIQTTSPQSLLDHHQPSVMSTNRIKHFLCSVGLNSVEFKQIITCTWFCLVGNETIPISSILPSGEALGKFLSGLSGGEASETLMVAFVDPAKVCYLDCNGLSMGNCYILLV